MSKLFFLAFVMSISCSLFGQTPADTATVSVETTVKEDDYESDPNRDRIIMDIHWDGWLGAPDTMNIKGLSSGIGLHFYYDIPLGSDNFSFATGAGLSWSNYYMDGTFNYDTAQVTQFAGFNDSISIDKNKFVICYFEVPVEFRYRTNPVNGNSFKVALGFKGGYTLSDHLKYVGEDYLAGSDDQIKYKTYRTKNLSNLQYGPTFRIGYGKVNLEAYYGLNTIFELDKGPEGSPLVIGVSFNPF